MVAKIQFHKICCAAEEKLEMQKKSSQWNFSIDTFFEMFITSLHECSEKSEMRTRSIHSQKMHNDHIGITLHTYFTAIDAIPWAPLALAQPHIFTQQHKSVELNREKNVLQHSRSWVSICYVWWLLSCPWRDRVITWEFSTEKRNLFEFEMVIHINWIRERRKKNAVSISILRFGIANGYDFPIVEFL